MKYPIQHPETQGTDDNRCKGRRSAKVDMPWVALSAVLERHVPIRLDMVRDV